MYYVESIIKNISLQRTVINNRYSNKIFYYQELDHLKLESIHANKSRTEVNI